MSHTMQTGMAIKIPINVKTINRRKPDKKLNPTVVFSAIMLIISFQDSI
ncbi:hypothetical protein [Flavobacterium sp. ASW18X]|nr:hypothetical protein [Flavobacterium sp. ASW18X]